MKVKSLVTGMDLTKDKVYTILHEYDSVYEVRCDSGIYCRAKEFFEVLKEEEQ